jgi:DNA polymerase III alpha subunit (gram-positive type)
MIQQIELSKLAGHLTEFPKITDSTQRANAMILIERLEDALNLAPAGNFETLAESARSLGAIVTSDDRTAAGELYASIVKAEKHVKEVTDSFVKFAYQRHCAAKAKQNTFLAPLATAKQTVKAIIELDLEEQRQAVEIERQRAQEEANAKARAEQAIRDKALQEAAEREKQAREKAAEERRAAEEAASKARSKVAQERAATELKAAKEREAAAKEAQRLADEERRNAAPIVAQVIETKAVERVEGVRIMKPVYKARVVDINAVPEMYLMPKEPNMPMLNAAAKALGMQCKIAGIEIYQDMGGIATKGK